MTSTRMELVDGGNNPDPKLSVGDDDLEPEPFDDGIPYPELLGDNQVAHQHRQPNLVGCGDRELLDGTDDLDRELLGIGDDLDLLLNGGDPYREAAQRQRRFEPVAAQLRQPDLLDGGDEPELLNGCDEPELLPIFWRRTRTTAAITSTQSCSSAEATSTQS